MTSTTSADGTPIGFQQSGTGAPLVLVDGAFGYRAGGPSGPLAELLTSRFAVYTYDRRGRGESGDVQPYAVEREVEDLAAVIGEAGGSAFVYGTSSGARLALLTTERAAQHGIEVTALALWEPNFVVGADRPPMPADYVERLEELVAADRREDAVVYFLTAGTGMPEPIAASMRGTPAMAWMASVAHTLAYDGRVVDGMKFDADRYATVDVPTLVLDGGSIPWLTGGANALATAMPSATRRTLTGQPHNVDAAAMAPALLEYFASVVPV